MNDEEAAKFTKTTPMRFVVGARVNAAFTSTDVGTYPGSIPSVNN